MPPLSSREPATIESKTPSVEQSTPREPRSEQRIVPEIGHQVARTLCEDGDVQRKSTQTTFNPSVGRLSVVMPSITHGTVLTWAVFEKTQARASGSFTVQGQGREYGIIYGEQKRTEGRGLQSC
ncbi:hypothetical protein P170DRAFT_425199 [Aspergillus steynii IBT 23096]|uniref:Uncharacterized protein n=1 Tax=Aspergillus steynii IBT 23096 TaxID=1392250 RepID=A0A2I2GDF8_9EURO|nr:uncharacterized protein P170DRAFT_425199 [Aspergillus steynii IBT 23096]PLB50903.1 hypothetical protein P170DRAFT_425199 [Aspergillus steynii IBT 23096]